MPPQRPTSEPTLQKNVSGRSETAAKRSRNAPTFVSTVERNDSIGFPGSRVGALTLALWMTPLRPGPTRSRSARV